MCRMRKDFKTQARTHKQYLPTATLTLQLLSDCTHIHGRDITSVS